MDQEELSLREIRLRKLEELRALGLDPYRVGRFDRTHSAGQLLAEFEALAAGEAPVAYAGRVVSYRLMGKAGFIHVSDGDEKIQVYVRKDDVGEAEWAAFGLLDIGDHVGVRGHLFLTKTGEKSISARTLIPLSKAIQPLPLGKEKDGHTFYGLTDANLRLRHRHLDLICNPDSRRALLDRSRIVSATRRFFDSRGYLEVETPVLQLEAGGAAARPFLTHFNAYDLDVKLRISLELYLKRLICGDVPRVYEIGRVFRNEGVSSRHNPEFTLLEYYEAYTDLEGMMESVESLFRFVCEEVYGTTKVTFDDGFEIDFGLPWQRVDLLQEISSRSGVPAEAFGSLESAKASLARADVLNPVNGKRVDVSEERHLGGLLEKMLEVFVEPTLQHPTFVLGYPIETSPLAKNDPARPGFTLRFEGYVRGREICNAFSEINDPIEQRNRFEHQLAEREAGDHEAHPMDEDFLYALECGMPPTGGCGIGMDRMAMLLAGAHAIREVLLFPMAKPE